MDFIQSRRRDGQRLQRQSGGRRNGDADRRLSGQRAAGRGARRAETVQAPLRRNELQAVGGGREVAAGDRLVRERRGGGCDQGRGLVLHQSQHRQRGAGTDQSSEKRQRADQSVVRQKNDHLPGAGELDKTSEDRTNR